MALTFPPIYLLKFHLERDPKELHRLEEAIHVVWDIREAKLVLGIVKSKSRATLELRKLGLDTEEVVKVQKHGAGGGQAKARNPHSNKRRKIDGITVDGKEVITLDSETALEPDTSNEDSFQRKRSAARGSSPAKSSPLEKRPVSSPGSTIQPSGETIKVLSLAWYTDSINAGKLLPIDDYLVYEGRVKSKSLPTRSNPTVLSAKVEPRRQVKIPSPTQRHSRHGSRKFGQQSGHSSSQPAKLIHETTSEDEAHSKLPPVPEYLHTQYSCQRPTPLHCPNEGFLSELRVIKQARTLKGDQIGIRAYSAAVAAVASYPYSLTSAYEINRLPGCGDKMAKHWQDWKDFGHVKEADEIRSDPDMQVLNLFWNIHGVGEVSAREFFNNGWRRLDDIVEHGWDNISRDQQIGVKYYDEFLQRIPREEVESIGNVVLDRANQIRDGFQMVVCGGYRRGKPDSGDVDVVLSHPNENATHRFLVDLLESLENDEYITHKLNVSMKNSDRGQNTLNWKGSMPRGKGGFDTLDHAFLVWQDPNWPSKAEDLTCDPDAKNPNVHRRVDIIISPWKTAGCAVVGWSGGTMFERDLRRYCKEKLGLKFDSSGVRRQGDGEWVDLEEGDGDLLVKEKRVFGGLGLEWREPTERCTD
ncbi:Nucleotidyltransferase [Hyaloscypha bicolor E]|uniref:DNA polymerase n=1 Tax=Hyaloscypha bicolor E TaxID=1095630 RepID=A0A2J6SFJ1_9HELO|nr:Nucleotidyltransferase [Hyaloscypha bicolor E]PMD49520.1 Nucleotidyltransferase [Hyaloscypha bicolor E]